MRGLKRRLIVGKPPANCDIQRTTDWRSASWGSARQ